MFTEIFDSLMNGEIQTFADLYENINGLKAPQEEKNSFLIRGFKLLKKLNWGIFEEMSLKQTPALWKELVIPHAGVKGAGDLKRSMNISSVFVGLLDIHGYTSFIRQSKGNLSKLHELDRFSETSVKQIAMEYGCIGARQQGDEILIIGPNASSVMLAVFMIIQVFAKENFFSRHLDVPVLSKMNMSLPVFPVSAGISGGNLNTPMIITKKGELSGFLLNTAARLQARANKLAPSSTKVIISRQVYTAYNQEKREKDSANLSTMIDFLNCGTIAFKGMSIAHYDVVFNKKEQFRLSYQEKFLSLFASVQSGKWHAGIFMDTVELLDAVFRNMPAFSFSAELSGFREEEASNESMRGKLKIIKNIFTIQEDYTGAVRKLSDIYEICTQVPDFDQLVLEYLGEITKRYNRIVHTFYKDILKEIEMEKDAVFTEQEKKLYVYFSANRHILEKLEEKARKSDALARKKQLWNTHIEKHRNKLELQLYSGKK